MVSENNYANNGYTVVSNDLDSKEEEILLNPEISEDMEVTLETTLNPKILRAMKNLYHKDATKI